MRGGLFLMKNKVPVMIEKIKWAAALLVLAGIIYGSYTLSRYVSVAGVAGQRAEVVIDAGHGGADPGKIGVNDRLEKDINLEIALKLKECLEKENISVILTRESDEEVEKGVTGNKKIADMKARVAMINEIRPQVAVSIHQNSYPGGEVKGAQVFFYSHSEKGEKMAAVMQEALLAVDPENHRKAKANDTYYLLKRTEVPTIIVECGFLSNREEAQKLAGEEYQQKLAEAVCEGIKNCLEK